MNTLCDAVSVAEVRDYLDEFSEWDEVVLRDGNDYMPLKLGFNSSWPCDWTSVADVQSLLDESGQWEPLRFRVNGIGYLVVGMVACPEPTLIVERVSTDSDE